MMMTEDHQTSISSGPKYPTIRQRNYVLPAAVGATLVIGVITAFSLYYAHNQANKSAARLPKSVISRVSGFHPYFVTASNTNYTLDSNSVSYQNNVLIFKVTDAAGNGLAVSEQPTPNGYDISALTPDKQFKTRYGQGYATDNALNTVGSLFTGDRTWILINASSSIGVDQMHQLLITFTPVK